MDRALSVRPALPLSATASADLRFPCDPRGARVPPRGVDHVSGGARGTLSLILSQLITREVQVGCVLCRLRRSAA